MKKLKKRIKIAFFTTSRAEFGNMSNLIQLLRKDKRLKILLFVGGAHLLKDLGNTIDEVKEKKIRIDNKFNFFSKKNTLYALNKQINVADKKINNLFKKFDFKYVILFGDRFELLPIISNTILHNKKLIHFGGGETTKGVIDDKIRNIVSSFADLHFTSSEEYRKALIKKGIHKNKVFNAGTLSISSIGKIKKNKLNLEKKICKNKFAIIAFQSITLKSLKENLRILKMIFKFLLNKNLNILITAPNKELYSDKILELIETKAKLHKNIFFVPSLGNNLFKHFLKKSEFIIGNSSAGVILAPFYKIPSINIGDRQKGRLMHSSVINTKENIISLEKSYKTYLSKKFRLSVKKMKFKLYKKNQLNFIKKKIINYANEN